MGYHRPDLYLIYNTPEHNLNCRGKNKYHEFKTIHQSWNFLALVCSSTRTKAQSAHKFVKLGTVSIRMRPTENKSYFAKIVYFPVSFGILGNTIKASKTSPFANRNIKQK